MNSLDTHSLVSHSLNADGMDVPESKKTKKSSPVKERILDPLIYRMVHIPESGREFVDHPVNYTDCVESSFLRFLQLVLSNFTPGVDEKGDRYMAQIDLPYLRSISDDADLIGFFEKHPLIFPADYYDHPNPGFETRTQWCSWLTKRMNRFSYVRTGRNEFLDDLVVAQPAILEGKVFNFEVDATVFNHVNFVAASFPLLREKLPPLSEIVEDLSSTSSYKPYFKIIGGYFSRPEHRFNLDMRILKLKRVGFQDFWFSRTQVAVYINDVPSWLWTISRHRPESSPIPLGAHSQIDLHPKFLSTIQTLLADSEED